MRRILVSVAIALGLAGPPVGALADTNLQPPLDQVLAQPPNGYSLYKPSGLPHGFFGLDEYAASWGGTNAQDASQILQQDGFVGGYELQWTDQTNTHVLIAIVIAFAGGKGAKSWYSTGDTADHHDPAFQHSDLISGLGSNAYGVHSALSNGLIVDAFAFAKGNDVFAVGFLSPHDDVLSLATSQVTAQYARAPDYTIPPDQWPENQNASSDAFPITGVLIALLIVGALAGLGAGGFVMLRRSQQAAAAAALAAPPVALQMSADGMFWYDGARWIDISVEAPPFAPRSPDGAMWWDGFNWRQVPEPVRAP